MSYHIFYNKQFIKVDENRVIPFILGGDNNVYDYNNKRARDWGNSRAHTLNGNIIVSTTDLLQSIDEFRETTKARADEQVKEYDESWAYDDKRWGYHVSLALYGASTRSTTFSQYKSFYKTGIKQALTIEELREHGVTITITPYRWKDEDITNKGLEIKPDVTFISTQHMLDTIKEYEDYYKGSITLYLSQCGMNGYIDRKKYLNRHKRYDRNREKVEVTVEEYWVLMYDGNKPFIKNLRNGFQYSNYLTGGKGFMTEKEANAFHKRMRNKEKFIPTKVGGTRTFRIFAS